MASEISAENRARAQSLVERAGTEWALDDQPDRAGRERLAAIAEELCAVLAGTRELDLAKELAACWSKKPPKGARSVSEILKLLDVQLSGDSVTPKTEVDSGFGAAGRDNETVELIADFLAESTEGLERVDEILMAAEQGAANSEQVNALFRVFHTIKGVSAFLGADDVTRLAHVSETLLGQVREGSRALRGRDLEIVFEASSTMRRLLGVVRAAVDSDRQIPTDASLPALIERIEHRTLVAASLAPAPEAPSAAQTSEAPTPPAPKPATPSLRPKSKPAPKRASRPTAARPAPEAEPAPAEATRGDAAQNGRIRETVKVDLERIDSVVDLIGELIIVESMIVHAPEISALSSLRLRNYLGQLTKISRDLQGVAMRMRMVPVRGVFQRMTRLVRDLSAKTGKPVRLVQLGEATEMDRSMVERIEEPLVHMLRNAIDHAIEPRDQRAAAGKPEMGVITITAEHVGGAVSIELRDDGRGLSRTAILNKAKERGLVGPEADQLPDADVYGLIFLPGFSTAAQVSELSGRGVGMDIVKRTIESMRGRVVVTSTPGQGTTFKLVLPLTLAIIDGMLISCGSERYIIPSLSIVESIELSPGMLHVFGNDGELIDVRGQILPMLRLAKLFEVTGAEQNLDRARVVVVESGGRMLAIQVDDVITQQQVVIKPLSDGVGKSDLLSGAAILSDGRVGLILNIDRIVEVFAKPSSARQDFSEAAE